MEVGYQTCDDEVCHFPTNTTTTATLVVVAPDGVVEPANESDFLAFGELRDRLELNFFGWDFAIKPSNLALVLVVAALGGFLLNLTPCVLPLIPIKVMGLAKSAGNRRRRILLGGVLSAGVIAFWLGLGLAISTVSGFTSTNKLFQYPLFTIGVGIVIWVMAVGMCGLFSARLPRWLYRFNPSQESVAGSFFFGVMTAVLSTPCTAPFMGAAAAWSAAQAPAITLSTFGAIGAGMAFPYFLLSAFPGLTARLPRTGPASDLIKQVMGLLIFAAGAYFFGTGLAGLVAQPPDPPTQVYWWLIAAFIVAAGFWLAWRTLVITKRAAARTVFVTLGLLFAVLGGGIGIRFTRGSPIHWTYYTPGRLAQAQAQGHIIVLEFTAAWCLNCHSLEQAVLHNPRVVEAFNAPGVTPVKVDITGNNPDGDRKLLEVGRRTIPYLVIYAPDGKEVFSSDAYTVENVLDALRKARLVGERFSDGGRFAGSVRVYPGIEDLRRCPGRGPYLSVVRRSDPIEFQRL
jgi:thiol:disulfide interchange protein DsbD